MSRRQAILARAALLASSSSSPNASPSASARPERLQDADDAVRALRRRPPTVPLEERSERANAPFRPRGDRPVPPRSHPVVVDVTPSVRATSHGTRRVIDTDARAKADATLLLKLKADQPVIEQAFSLSAPAKVPKAIRQKFLNTLAAKKLREAAGVGERKDVPEIWIDANRDACRRAVKDAVDEEMMLHTKATSKVTYRNFSAQLLLRGGTTPKPPPGALAQDYRCKAADSIDLGDARTVRGDAQIFFANACKRRKGDAHSRWLQSTATMSPAPTPEVALEPFVEIKSPIKDSQMRAVHATPSAREAVMEFCHKYLEFLMESGITTWDIADAVELKVVEKVMKVHVGAKDGAFLAKEAASVKKLIESQIVHETKSNIR